LALILSTTVSVVVGYVVAAVCGGVGLALLMSGPIGFIPGVILAAIMMYYGKDVAKEIVKTWEIPVLGRKAILWDTAIETTCKQAETKIKAAVEQQLNEDQEQLAQEIAQKLIAVVQRKAEQLALLIQC
jgi:hypothetical protein